MHLRPIGSLITRGLFQKITLVFVIHRMDVVLIVRYARAAALFCAFCKFFYVVT